MHDEESRRLSPKRAILAVLALALFAACVHAGVPGFTDADSLYHIRHAWVYRTGGLGQSTFPWLPYSAIEREASNLWYGFQVLLMPFTFGNLLVGIRVAALVFTAATLVLVWCAFLRLGARAPLLATLLFACLTGDSLFRLTMLRPQGLSLGIALALFAELCSEKPSWRRSLAIGAVFAWIHVSIAWLPVALWVVTSCVRLAGGRKPAWAAALGIAAGLVAGAFARPNPMGAIRLAGIQIPIWLAKKSAAVLYHVGRELRPWERSDLLDRLTFAILVFAAGAALLLVRPPGAPRSGRLAVAGRASLVLGALFLAMSFLVARRANDLFVAFATILAASAADPWIAAVRGERAIARRAPFVALALASIAAPVFGLWRFRGYLQAAAPIGPQKMRASSNWIRQNARAGDIVFNVNWDTFPRLFFWSPETYCVSGNDPVFLYAADPERYWITRQLESDAMIEEGGRGLVCANPPCPSDRLEDVHTAMVERFRAQWVLLQARRTPKLFQYLARDPRFRLVFENGDESVFAVLP